MKCDLFVKNKVFYIQMDGVPVLLYFRRPCYKLSFSGLFPSVVPYQNMCHYNCNTHNVAFCIFSCKTFNNFYKLLVIIISYAMKSKQIDHISNIISTPHDTFIKGFNFFLNEGNTGNVPKFEFDKFQRPSHDINVTFTSS